MFVKAELVHEGIVANVDAHRLAKSSTYLQGRHVCSLFVWLVADGWCWFVLREKYC
jgi:hypothetical protein